MGHALSRRQIDMPLLIIRRISPPEAADLIAELDAYQEGLYPPESNHLESIDQLSDPNVKMVGCQVNEDLVAISAVKLMANYGEIKRLYVSPEYRGMGIAKRLIKRLEVEIKNAGLGHARLETGVLQNEAIGLYEEMGYSKRGPFGRYKADPLSIFMEKKMP